MEAIIIMDELKVFCAYNEIKDKTILIIDDVKTTGATLSSASLTLKAYGAKEVYCAVLAIVK